MKTKMMKRVVTIVLALCMALTVLAAGAFADNARSIADETPVTAIDRRLSVGDAMPNFTVTLQDGSVFTLSEALKDHQIVMINLWASWCGPCCAELPVMEDAYQAYKDDVAIVCLSYTDENKEITDFMAENNINLPMGADTLGLTEAVQQGYIPITLMVDRFGNLVYFTDGGFSAPEQYTELWDTFLGENYTQSQFIYDN